MQWSHDLVFEMMLAVLHAKNASHLPLPYWGSSPGLCILGEGSAHEQPLSSSLPSVGCLWVLFTVGFTIVC